MKTLIAQASLYFIWGTTYLAIRFVVESAPPFLAAGARFICSGALILLWFKIKYPEIKLSAQHWWSTAITGVLLLGGGNGLVSLAETRVNSGMTALFVSSMPFWVVLIDWLRPRGMRPSQMTVLGLLLGLVGMVFLVSPRGNAFDAVSVTLLVGSTICWATGSLISKHRQMPASPFLTTGMQMLVGGIFLIGLGSITGEWRHFSLEALSTQAILAWAYLVVFGSLLGFTAYIWLIKNVPPAQATTYSFVNPIVALLIGAWLNHEPLSLRVVFSAAVILAGVLIILNQKTVAQKGHEV